MRVAPNMYGGSPMAVARSRLKKEDKGNASCLVCPAPRSEPIEGARQIDPQVVAAQFMDHCISQGWVVTRRVGGRKSFFMTKEGEKALRKLDITP